MKGMHNKALIVDLTTKTTADMNLDDQILTDYIGGRGLGAKLFIDMTQPKLNPDRKSVV